MSPGDPFVLSLSKDCPFYEISKAVLRQAQGERSLLAPRVGRGAGEGVGAVVFRMAGVALDPMPFDPVGGGGVEQGLP